MKKVSIILLNYNGIRYTLKCLKSLQKIDYPNYEIIVVDNGSTDDSIRLLRNKKGIRLVENKENKGFAEGNNIGVRAAKGKYIALLNNDTFVKKNWLKELVKAVESDDKIGAVMSKIYNKYQEKRYKFDGYGTMTLLGYFAWNRKVPKDTKKKVDLFFASGCSLLYKKRLVEEPFDPDYFIYAEDTYLSWLLRIKGYTIKMVPSSVVYHEGGAVVKNIREMSDFFTELGERNRLMNLFIFYNAWTILKLVPLVLLTLIFNSIYDYKRLMVRFKAYLWLLRNLKKISKKRRNIQKQRRVTDKEVTVHMSYKLAEEENISNALFRAVIKLLNAMSFLYCWIFGLRTMEFKR